MRLAVINSPFSCRPKWTMNRRRQAPRWIVTEEADDIGPSRDWPLSTTASCSRVHGQKEILLALINIAEH